MDARGIAVIVLLGLAGLVVAGSAVGFLAARDSLPRLHFLTPVTSLAAPLTAAAYLVQLGPGLAAGLAVAIVALLAVTGPVLGSAVGRVSADVEDVLPRDAAQ